MVKYDWAAEKKKHDLRVAREKLERRIAKLDEKIGEDKQDYDDNPANAELSLQDIEDLKAEREHRLKKFIPKKER